MNRTADIRQARKFRLQAIKAIASIFIFVLTYLLILLGAAGLTFLCVSGGVMLFIASPALLTVILGLGLISLAVLVLIFLLKFLIKSYKTDRSHLYEITGEEEPDLFNLIEKIAQGAGTSLPKKVYFSADVNAAVFYDSGFWSMFFPIKKNLIIGLGLVNTVTTCELTAILAHEFGHFSQKTMKVGSYVYHVNQIIFNMLYDNESYDRLVQQWARASGNYAFFVVLAVKIVLGIQWILRKLYDMVNKSYMGLSREMEFQADEVAARLVGAAPLESSLLRMPLANHSFNEVLNFYEGKATEKLKSENLYKEQKEVMALVAAANNFPIRNNLPEISLAEQSKFATSRLVVTDQWASHPGVKERIERLSGLDIQAEEEADSPANSLINDTEKVQKRLTDELFKAFNYEGEAKILPFACFKEEYSGRFTDNAFPAIYNGYYDHKNPLIVDVATIEQSEEDEALNFQELFSDDKVSLVYTGIALKNDIESLKRIADRVFAIKTFDYDGIKYKQRESRQLIPKLEKQLDQINELIKEHDIKIFRFFSALADRRHRWAAMEKAYADFFKFDEDFDAKYDIFTRLSDKLKFINNNTPLEKITAGLSEIKALEAKLKYEITAMLGKDSLYESIITTDTRDSLERYISKDWNYFDGVAYVNESLSKLYTAMNYYAYLLSRGYFLVKKEFLIFQEAFLENISHVK